MMVFIRFWRSLTKNDSVTSARYEIQHFFYFYSKFRKFFHESGSYPDFWSIQTQKKVWSGSGEKTRIRNTGWKNY